MVQWEWGMDSVCTQIQHRTEKEALQNSGEDVGTPKERKYIGMGEQGIFLSNETPPSKQGQQQHLWIQDPVTPTPSLWSWMVYLTSLMFSFLF